MLLSFKSLTLFKLLPQALAPAFSVKAADMPTENTDPKWRQVQGVEICFVLYGNELIDLKDLPKATRVTQCGQSKDLTELTGARKSRIHLLFRNTFQLRSQGLL
jgi:type IV pilus assembly protein PilW